MFRLEVRDLHVSYGKVRALQGISLTVEERQILSLVGANGAGKSTVLKAIMGLVPLAGGEICLGNQRLNRMNTPQIVRAGVAISAEGRRLFPEMTVQENLTMGAYQRSSRAAAAAMDEVYEYFPILAQRRNQLAGSLSGGQQQMVAIGRALMSGPRLLLLDEPSLGLAPLIVRDIAAIIRRIHQQGVSVILVEQNARMALKLSDQACVLETGRIILSGTGQELMNHPEVQRSYLGL